MGYLISRLLCDMTFSYINLFFVFALFIFFLVYALSKEGRDEHGRGILGRACLYGVIALFVGMNLLTLFTYTVTSDPLVYTNAVRLVFNAFFLTADLSILILRKLR